MRHLFRILIGLFLIFNTTSVVAKTFETIPLTGRVVDEAGLLSVEEQASLVQLLKDHEATTTQQVVVATVRSLDGYSVEDYANRLFNAWGLGQKDKNNGVLLLVAPNERKVRIEVGYGLEGVLPDATASQIIQRVILPAFRAKNFSKGIMDGAEDMIQILSGGESAIEDEVAPDSTPEGFESEVQESENSTKIERVSIREIPFYFLTAIQTFFLLFFLYKKNPTESLEELTKKGRKQEKRFLRKARKLMRFLLLSTVSLWIILLFIVAFVSKTIFLMVFSFAMGLGGLTLFLGMIIALGSGRSSSSSGSSGSSFSSSSSGGSFSGGGGRSGGGGASGSW